jgi:hypothetical protein
VQTNLYPAKGFASVCWRYVNQPPHTSLRPLVITKRFIALPVFSTLFFFILHFGKARISKDFDSEIRDIRRYIITSHFMFTSIIYYLLYLSQHSKYNKPFSAGFQEYCKLPLSIYTYTSYRTFPYLTNRTY